MTPLLRLARLLVAAAPRTMLLGALLSVLVPIMGAALLGLSGWFITATGIAGLLGAGAVFDVFRPSAGVRFLAVGRTATRYGERVLTHDATLCALAALRIDLLRRRLGLGGRDLDRLRGEDALARITADVDATDGLVLRLILPAIAALITHLTAFLGLGLLAGWPVAFAVALGYVPTSAILLWRAARTSAPAADRAETRTQSLRKAAIDLMRGREALILSGKLPSAQDRLANLDAGARAAAAEVDCAERNAAFGLSTVTGLAVALALIAGDWLFRQGAAGPAAAAIGGFLALALAETLMPLRRGVTEIGRIAGAAARLMDVTDTPADRMSAPAIETAPLLALPDGTALNPGQALALIGPSGAGKTTLLLTIAGLLPDPDDKIRLQGRAPTAIPEDDLRRLVTLVPQRSRLLAGTVRENLVMAGDATDEDMRAALAAVALTDALAPRGGLDATLSEGGAGLSGGETKRLAIARALLRRPALLLLDEPTEGLDARTADSVLSRIRTFAPEAAILAALHRHTGHSLFAGNLRSM